MSTVIVQTLVKKLTEGSTSFKFRKVDGTIREATGTLNADLIPAGAGTPTIPAENAASISYYDLDKGEFRAFRTENIITA